MRILITFFILFSNALFSQTSLLNAEKPSQFEDKALNNVNSLEFNEVEENDILWSKVTYEYIDLNEKLTKRFLPIFFFCTPELKNIFFEFLIGTSPGAGRDGRSVVRSVEGRSIGRIGRRSVGRSVVN